MQFTLDRETLLKPLQLVMGVVERKQTMPILSNVLINLSDNKLSVTGTDLEIELIGQNTVQVSSGLPGKITLPGRKLYEICKALPEGASIEMVLDKERATLKSGKSRFTLAVLPTEHFPNLDEHIGQLQFNLSQRVLKYLLQRTYFAMAENDVRYHLNGTLFEVRPGNFRTVATDGHRLAFNVIDAPIKESHRIQAIVPRKGVLELMKLLSDTENDLSLIIGSNNIRVIGDGFIFTSKLIESRFPDYDRVIPKPGNKFFLIERDVLREALMRVSILSNDQLNGVRFEIRKNLLRLLSNNPEQEAAEEEIYIEYPFEDFETGFNIKYLLDILNCLKAGPIKFDFTDSTQSIRIEEEGSNGESLFVIMPLRL